MDLVHILMDPVHGPGSMFCTPSRAGRRYVNSYVPSFGLCSGLLPTLRRDSFLRIASYVLRKLFASVVIAVDSLNRINLNSHSSDHGAKENRNVKF